MAFAAPSVPAFTAWGRVSVVTWSTRPLPRLTTRRSSARIFALGGAAAPPPPPEPESKPEAETPEAASAAPETTSEDAAPAASPAPGANGTVEPAADDILSSPSFLKKKLEIVTKELNEAKAASDKAAAELDVQKKDYVRLAADFENFRRRNALDFSKLESKSTAKVCKAILVVLDNFDRAIAAVSTETEREASIQKSYTAINKQLVDALVKLGVETVDPIGVKFDPEVHEAIQQLESTEYSEDMVCAVYQKGYKIEDMLVRAAIVAVSTGPGPEVPDGAGATTPAPEAEATDVEAAAEAGEEGKKTEDTK